MIVFIVAWVKKHGCLMVTKKRFYGAFACFARERRKATEVAVKQKTPIKPAF